MQSKGFIILWIIMGLLVFYNPLLAQEERKPVDRKTLVKRHVEPRPLEQYTEEEVIDWIDREMSDCKKPGTECFPTGLHVYAEIAVALKSDKIVQKILDVPEYDPGVTQAKITALRLFKDFPGVRDYVIKSLDIQSRSIQAAAAATLLSWGEWDLAAPFICKTEAYIVFQENKDERAVPLLEKAVKNGSWKGRVNAASILCYTYGDTVKCKEFALDIMMKTPLDTDDKELNMAKHWALMDALQYTWEPIIPGLCRLAYDDKFYLRSKAVDDLAKYSVKGSQKAKLALEEIINNHPDEKIIEQAKKGLLELEQQQK